MFTGNIMEFNGQGTTYVITFQGISSMTQGNVTSIASSVFLPVSFIIVILSALTAIFLFRKRKVQKLLVMVLIAAALLSCATEAYYWYFAAGTYKAVLLPKIRMIIPLADIVLAVLAWIGIERDDRLVRSYDRLR